MTCGHKMLNMRCKSCKKLAVDWDKKLKASGLDNIEQLDGNLKSWASHYFKSKFKTSDDVIFQEAKIEYYRRARQFLHEYLFTDIRTKRIWELHSEGISFRDIIVELKKEGYNAYRDLVQEVVKSLSSAMLGRLSEDE